MKLIAGLGNPGDKYRNNRHNVGFMIVDGFARQNGSSWRYNSDLMCHLIKNNDYLLSKPAIYMNKSGESLRSVANFYRINPKDVLAVYDDLDLEFGAVRLAFNGSSAGHHGVESVIVSLGTVDFGRLRIGIGKPHIQSNQPKSKEQMVIDHVLSDFTSDEKEKLGEIFNRAFEAIQSYIDEGIVGTMNRFN